MPPWREAPYSLISWWAMQRFGSAKFQRVIETLDVLECALFPKQRLLEVALGGAVPPQAWNMSFQALAKALADLRLFESVQAVEDLQRSYALSAPTPERLGGGIAEIRRSISREMNNTLFLRVERHELYSHACGFRKF